MLNSLLSDVAKHLIIFYNNPAILKNEIAYSLVVGLFLKIKLTSNSIISLLTYLQHTLLYKNHFVTI